MSGLIEGGASEGSPEGFAFSFEASFSLFLSRNVVFSQQLIIVVLVLFHRLRVCMHVFTATRVRAGVRVYKSSFIGQNGYVSTVSLPV